MIMKKNIYVVLVLREMQKMIKHLIAKGEDPNEGKEYRESSPLGVAAYYVTKMK